MYHVTLEKFTGPLELLLEMVEGQKLSINEISLAQVADQYITYLKSLDELSKEELAAFLVVAASLILIKSRSLLPDLTLTEEEASDIKELAQRLRMLQFFKLFASQFAKLQQQGQHLFGREAYSGMRVIFLPPNKVSAQTLKTVIQEMLASLPVASTFPTDAIAKAVSLEDKIKELRERLEKRAHITFEEMKQNAKERIEVIVSFLALLELIKQGFLLFEQKWLFGPIRMAKQPGENHE